MKSSPTCGTPFSPLFSASHPGHTTSSSSLTSSPAALRRSRSASSSASSRACQSGSFMSSNAHRSGGASRSFPQSPHLCALAMCSSYRRISLSWRSPARSQKPFLRRDGMVAPLGLNPGNYGHSTQTMRRTLLRRKRGCAEVTWVCVCCITKDKARAAIFCRWRLKTNGFLVVTRLHLLSARSLRIEPR